MKTQELDPFAIKNYSFALGKTNSFFSFTTVILSIGVIVLSVFISFDAVSHLWLPLNELPKTVVPTQQFPGPLSPTLLCFNLTDPALNGTIPSYRVWNSNFEFLSIPYVSQEQALKRNPNLLQVVGGNFGCLDLAGLQFSMDQSTVLFEVQVTQAWFYVQAANIDALINNQPNTFVKSKSQIAKPWLLGDDRYAYINSMKLFGLNAHIYDSLMINDKGKHLRYFSDVWDSKTNAAVNSFVTKTTPIKSNFAVFVIDIQSLPAMPIGIRMTTLTITRSNIGFIIGAVLSWVSVFGLICGFIVGPIMDKVLNLIQAETLFHLPKEDRKPSVFKYIVAQFKKGIFPKEDKYIKLVDELQRLKDVSCSLKMQKTLRRICPKSSKLCQNQVIAAEHNFDEPQIDEASIQTYSEGGKYSSARFNAEQDCKDQNILVKARKGFLNWLDSGSDTVSINYSGRGHGSKQSVLVSSIFLIGFIAFLVIFGVLKYSAQQTRSFSRGFDDLSHTLVPNQLLVTNMFGGMVIYLVDGYGTKIRKLNTYESNATVSNPCLQYVNDNQLRMVKLINEGVVISAAATVFTCLTEDIQLVASKNPLNIRSLWFDYTIKPTYRIIHMQVDPSSVVADQIISLTYTYTISSVPLKIYSYAKLTIFNTIEDGNTKFSGTQLQFLNTKVPVIYRGMYGFYLTLNINQINNYATNTDFFTIVQNIWGLATIAFTVILVKLTKYINIRQKQKAITTEKSEFRDNLCIFLSKINGLLSGRNKNELQKAKYYLKQPIPIRSY